MASHVAALGRIRTRWLIQTDQIGESNAGMSRAFTDVWKDAAELSDEDRATLAGLLIESLEGEPEPEVEAAWAAEIAKRVAELDAGTIKGVPWEQVRQRLLDRLHGR